MKKLARLTSIQELYELFGHLFPEHLLAASDVGTNSRERVFTPQVTFWAFVAQILIVRLAWSREIEGKRIPKAVETRLNPDFPDSLHKLQLCRYAEPA